MFLARVEIPWERSRNPYEVHREIWRLFPGQARESRVAADDPRDGFLFRIEESRLGQPVRVLVQSRVAPRPTAGIDVLGVREFRPAPGVGQTLFFTLTANPVRMIRDADQEQKASKTSAKCRVPLIKEADQRAWISRKLEAAAVVATTNVTPERPIYFRKGAHGGKIVPVTFSGLLTVKDPAALRSMLTSGVGPAKAFGCGLMLVRRA